jgi:hypothetical protein
MSLVGLLAGLCLISRVDVHAAADAPPPVVYDAPITDQPAEKTAEKPAEKAVEEPTEKPAEKPVEQPAEKAVEKPAEKARENEAGKADEKSPATTPEKKDVPKAARPKAAPKKVLTPEQTALRDRIRATLAFQHQQPFNTHDSSPADLIHFCWAFGCQTEVAQGDSSGQRINGITCLCWDFPCGGYRLLTTCDGHIAARVGYGLQQQPAQFLAMLAVGHVPADYPLRAGDTTRTVADLVEYEKLSCRSGTDLSLKLIGLSHYVDQPTWTNDLGEPWSIQHLVKEVLSRPAIAGPTGINKLLGLSFALAGCQRRKQAPEGELARAKQFVEDYQNYALQAQNTDGSWDLPPVPGRRTERDYTSLLMGTGQMVEWLALSLPEDRLEDARLAKSLDYLENMLDSQRYHGYLQAASSRDLAAVARALHGLAVYDARVFKPTDVKEPAAAGKEKVAEK